MVLIHKAYRLPRYNASATAGDLICTLLFISLDHLTSQPPSTLATVYGINQKLGIVFV